MKKISLLVAMLLTATLSQAQWEPDVRLTNDPSASSTSYNNAWCIAASGDTIHVVWYDSRNGNTEIYYKRSVDGGISWGPDTRLTTSLGYSESPSIAISGSLLHVVWYDHRTGSNDIFYKSSTDGGETWGADTQLTSGIADEADVSLAASGSYVYIVWDDDRWGNYQYQTYFMGSADGGLTWGDESRLSNTATYSGFPTVAANGPDVLAFWEDDRTGNGDIFYKRSANGGLTWGQETQLTTDPADSWDPSVSVYDSLVNVVWMDSRHGSYEIYFKRSTDLGISWGPDTRLTDASGDSKYPNLNMSDLTTLHVVWEDNRYGNFEIFYKRSADGGLSWEQDIRLTSTTGISEHASVAIADSTVHVTWTDARDGNKEIYYRRNLSNGYPLGIDDAFSNMNEKEIEIYPNPASDKAYIKFNQGFTGDAKICVYNILGEKLINTEIRESETMIDVSRLQKGVYYVTVTLEKKPVICKKLIVSGK